MKPDRIERAHLRDPRDLSHTMHRYHPPAELTGLVQRFWIPVWSVEPGREAVQRVLQYPCALLVVAPDYARFYGVVSGLSTTTLTGDGWAVGVMCEPAGGWLIAGRSMAEFRDRFVDLAEVLDDAAAVERDVREAMTSPRQADSHAAATARMSDVLRRFLPVDDEGRQVNEVVAFVEQHPDVVRVAQVGERFDLTERALQRLVRRRVGLSPKWLIQRRRLQEASVRLRERPASLAEVAADLGYADQPHFTRDFRSVTGMTPGEFAARYS
ncbi:MAG TPA: helix-turn-helix transcriptional regulator [Nakamurella sp.]